MFLGIQHFIEGHTSKNKQGSQNRQVPASEKRTEEPVGEKKSRKALGGQDIIIQEKKIGDKTKRSEEGAHHKCPVAHYRNKNTEGRGGKEWEKSYHEDSRRAAREGVTKYSRDPYSFTTMGETESQSESPCPLREKGEPGRSSQARIRFKK